MIYLVYDQSFPENPDPIGKVEAPHDFPEIALSKAIAKFGGHPMVSPEKTEGSSKSTDNN